MGKTCLSPSRSPAHRSATQGAVSFTGPPPHAAPIAPFYISTSYCFHFLHACWGEGRGRPALLIGDQGMGVTLGGGLLMTVGAKGPG